MTPSDSGKLSTFVCDGQKDGRNC